MSRDRVGPVEGDAFIWCRERVLAAGYDDTQVLNDIERLARLGFWTMNEPDYSGVFSPGLFRVHDFDAAPPKRAEDVTAQYHPEDRNVLVKKIGRCFEFGEPFACHYRMVRRTGEVRLLWTRGERYREGPRGTRAIRGVTQDVTEMRAHEATMHSQASSYRFLAENTRDLITRITLDGRFAYVSAACKPVLGYTAEELVGARWADYIHPEDLGPMMEAVAAFWRNRAGRDRVRLEHRFRCKDGRWLWLEGNPRFVVDVDGRVLECVDVVRDITERKASEAALAAARADAEAAAAAKSDFLANMSHELRTPLTSILGFARLLAREEGLSAEGRRQLQLVCDAGNTLLGVVNDILDFSRLDAGAVELQLEPFSVSRFVSDTAALVQSLADEKGLLLQVEADHDAVLMGDLPRLRQILLNLLSNALKFTAAGSVTVRARVDDASDEAVRLQLEVADTGIGIPEDKLAGLFDRFSQVDGSITRRFGGTGLGLAIATRLAELMGGRIEVATELDAGSSFFLKVILDRAKETLDDEPPSTPELDTERPPRLLVVEDHKVNQALARVLLEELGCIVDVADDGAQALAAVQIQFYDAVLMDMQMPVMDGLAATRAIRALPGPVSTLPIVAMTANVLPEQVQRCRAAGMDAHVAKPIDPISLVKVLSEMLAERPVHERGALVSA